MKRAYLAVQAIRQARTVVIREYTITLSPE